MSLKTVYSLGVTHTTDLYLTEKFLDILQNLANVPIAIENSNLQVSSANYGGKWYYLYRIISEV
jgi:hypothetical protein